MTTAQVVETSVTVNSNSPIQDYVHPDDQTQSTFEMTLGFKPFTIIKLLRKYVPEYFFLIEETGRKIKSLTISSWKLSLNSGGKREGLFFAGSTLLTKYSLDILQFCKHCFIETTSFNYTARLNCKNNCTHINQQYLSRIFNLWKRTSDWKLQPFHGKMLIEKYLIFSRCSDHKPRFWRSISDEIEAAMIANDEMTILETD